jgi:hypothetical protein
LTKSAKYTSRGALTGTALCCYGWASIANHRLLRRGAYPRLLGRIGRAAGLAVLVGAAVVGLGLVAWSVPVLRYALLAVGGIVGLIGYLAWPVWFALAGRRLTPGRA